MTAKQLYEILSDLKIPVVYMRTKEVQPLPYIVYLGDGQNQFSADNTYYTKQNNYRIELYFKAKDESLEEEIEDLLLDNGLQYDKSDDIYISSQDCFEIYYEI